LDNLREDQLSIMRFCEDLANGFYVGGLSDMFLSLLSGKFVQVMRLHELF
jgi:hypothetical protein